MDKGHFPIESKRKVAKVLSVSEIGNVGSIFEVREDSNGMYLITKNGSKVYLSEDLASKVVILDCMNG